MFQSAPGTCAGRCNATPVLRNKPRSFNPRPARVPGDARPPRYPKALARVSIRARHVCRAMHAIAQAEVNRLEVSIRARHVCRAMPTRRAPLASRSRCFNPRPARVPGDAGVAPGKPRVRQGFNPRPARVPGDALILSECKVSDQVSIRARHVCRAMRRYGEDVDSLKKFQSAPGTCAGRC